MEGQAINNMSEKISSPGDGANPKARGRGEKGAKGGTGTSVSSGVSLIPVVRTPLHRGPRPSPPHTWSLLLASPRPSQRGRAWTRLFISGDGKLRLRREDCHLCVTLTLPETNPPACRAHPLSRGELPTTLILSGSNTAPDLLPHVWWAQRKCSES